MVSQNKQQSQDPADSEKPGIVRRRGKVARWAMKSTAKLISKQNSGTPPTGTLPIAPPSRVSSASQAPARAQKESGLRPGELNSNDQQKAGRLPFQELPHLSVPPLSASTASHPPTPLVLARESTSHPPNNGETVDQSGSELNRPLGSALRSSISNNLESSSQVLPVEPCLSRPPSGTPHPLADPEVSPDTPFSPRQEQPRPFLEALRKDPAASDPADFIRDAADVNKDVADVNKDVANVVQDADVVKDDADVNNDADDVIKDCADNIGDVADVIKDAADVVEDAADVVRNFADVTEDVVDVNGKSADVIEAASLLSAPPAFDAMVIEAASLLSSAAEATEAESVLSADKPDPAQKLPSSPSAVANGEPCAANWSLSPVSEAVHDTMEARSSRHVECQTDPERVTIEGTNIYEIFPLEGWIVQRVELVRREIGSHISGTSERPSIGHC